MQVSTFDGVTRERIVVSKQPYSLTGHIDDVIEKVIVA